MRTTTTFTLLAFTCCLRYLSAEPSKPSNWASLAQLAPRAEIRVSLNQGENLTGSLLSVSDDSLVIETGNGERSLPRADVTRVQVKRTGRRVRHALIGMAVGAGGGLITVAALHDAKECTGFCVGPDVGHSVKMAAVPVGAGLGALIGAALPAGKWTDVYIAPSS